MNARWAWSMSIVATLETIREMVAGGAEAVSGRIRISIIEGTQAARFLRGSIRCSLARGRQPGKATGLRS